MDIHIKRAIISVSDKEGIVDFAKELSSLGVEIISTGGTARLLKDSGITVVAISDYTGFPEILDGRVKTLHPKIHGGILARHDNKEHMAVVEREGIGTINLVVVNLYPFEETVAGGCTFEDAIENIDIGGPTMVRAAAKNFRSVAVVVDPADYAGVLKEMKSNNGAVSEDFRFELSRKAFRHIANYDSNISQFLDNLTEEKTTGTFPGTIRLQFEKIQDLRYGENPHQEAAFYKEIDGSQGASVAGAKQLQGKELSFNNILDLHAALELVKEFKEPALVIIKHNNPCGAALSADGLKTAYTRALSSDPVSAFGGIIGCNRTIDEETAREMTKIFLEAVIAPGFDERARTVFSEKKNIRLMEVPLLGKEGDESALQTNLKSYDFKRVSGGLLLQTSDIASAVDLKVVTAREPTESELDAMLFGWKVAKHVKSNAIVFSNAHQLLGTGVGQMSRVDSVRLGIMKARDAGLNLEGAIMASDAFFPFRDGIDVAAEAGIRAIVQPGGSIHDEKVIAAVNEHKMAMVFTGVRHFRH
jgi:phosphoribosylaminoimidazolecarboxamide formyltransferase/IMP cyclohydrolase